MAVWECSISHHSHGAAPGPGGDAGGLAGSPLSHAISFSSSGFCGPWSVVPTTPQPLSHPPFDYSPLNFSAVVAASHPGSGSGPGPCKGELSNVLKM